MEERFIVSWDFIQEFMETAFIKMGIPKKDAEICADVLMESDRRGIEITRRPAHPGMFCADTELSAFPNGQKTA